MTQISLLQLFARCRHCSENRHYSDTLADDYVLCPVFNGYHNLQGQTSQMLIRHVHDWLLWLWPEDITF